MVAVLCFGAPALSLTAVTSPPPAPPQTRNTSPTESSEQKNRIIDRDAPPQTEVQLRPLLKFGGRAEFSYDVRRNFDLKDGVADEDSTIEPFLSLAAAFKPNEKFKSFLEMRLFREIAVREKRLPKKRRRNELEISQAYLLFKDIVKHSSLKVGRQRLRDEREWYYDKRLDAARIAYKYHELALDFTFGLEGAIDKDLLNEETDRRVDDYLLELKYPVTKKIDVALYNIFRYDHSADARRPYFVGLHSQGEIIENLKHWLELAYTLGQETRISRSRGTERTFWFRGLGFDVGADYQFKLPWKPGLALGYAFGSGDNEPNDGDHRGFRQTGLQNNSTDLNGLSSVQYYGELFDPELSNLMVFTAGSGIKPFQKASVEVLYHSYLQHRPANTIKESNLLTDPSGRSRRLGNEIDFVIALEDIKKFDVQTIFGLFLPGQAFPQESDNPAFFSELKLRYNF